MEPLPAMLSKTHSISLILKIILIFISFFVQATIINSDCLHCNLSIINMDYSGHLQQHFFETFIGKGQNLLSKRQLTQLTQESSHSVEDIFMARYDEAYLNNIPNRQVFEKTVKDLESIIDASRRTKAKSKNKPGVILQDQTYLDHYLQVLFTDEEKKVLQKLIDSNFQQEPQETTEQQGNAIEVTAYVLKNIFSITGKQETEAEEVQGVYQAGNYDYPFQSWERD